MKNILDADFISRVLYNITLVILDRILILTCDKFYKELIEKCGSERDPEKFFRYIFKKKIEFYISECKEENQVNDENLIKFKILSDLALDEVIDIINNGLTYDNDNWKCGNLFITYLRIDSIQFSKFLDDWLAYPTNSCVRIYIKLYTYFSDLKTIDSDFLADYRKWKRKRNCEDWEKEFVKLYNDYFGILYEFDKPDEQMLFEASDIIYDNIKSEQEVVNGEEHFYWLYFILFEKVDGKMFYNFVRLIVYLSISPDVPYNLAKFAKDIFETLKENPKTFEMLKESYNIHTRNSEYLWDEKSSLNSNQIVGMNQAANLESYNLNMDKDSFSKSVSASEKEFYDLSYNLAKNVYEFLSDNEVFKVNNIDLTNFILFIQSADFKYLGNKEIEKIVKKNIFGRTCCSIKDYVIIGDDDIKVEWLNKVASQLYHNTQKKPIHLCTSPSNPSKEKLERLKALEKEMKKEYSKIYS